MTTASPAACQRVNPRSQPPTLPASYTMTGDTTLSESRPLFNKTGDDAFNQGDFGVFESLKAPAVEFQAKDPRLTFETRLDHFQHARFAGAPIAMHSDGHWLIGTVA